MGTVFTVAKASLFAAMLAAPPRGDNRLNECVASAELGQVRRDQGKLLEARAAFVSCVRDVCPPAIRRDCATFAADVEKRLPSVVFAAKNGNGADLVDVRVIVDGTPLLSRIVAVATALDPGLHVVRLEHDGDRPVEIQVMLREGEQARQVSATFGSPPPAPPPKVEPPPTTVSTRSERPVPVMTWMLGGVALAAGGGFAALRLKGVDDGRALEDECAPSCPHDRVDDVRTTFLVSNIVGGVAIAAAIGAIVFYVLRPSTSVRSTSGGSLRIAF